MSYTRKQIESAVKAKGYKWFAGLLIVGYVFIAIVANNSI